MYMNNIEDLDKINNFEDYFGEVVEIDESTQHCRIRVKVHSIFDDIPTEYLPWSIPLFMDNSTYDLPYIGEIIHVKFENNDKYHPRWYRKHTKKYITPLEDSDYKQSSIIFEKDLSKFDMDGYLSVYYSKTDGLKLELKRNDNTSNFIIGNGNDISINNGNSKQSIHIADDNISIGSLKRSQQPAVVGDDNKTALEMLNGTVKELFELHKEMCTILSKSASSSPYTKHLTVPFRNLGEKLESKMKMLYNDNDNFFPETLSAVVTIDKTNENG